MNKSDTANLDDRPSLNDRAKRWILDHTIQYHILVLSVTALATAVAVVAILRKDG